MARIEVGGLELDYELIPGSIFAEPPWGDKEWNYVSTFPNIIEERRGRFERWPLMAPPVLEFLKEMTNGN